MDPLTIAVLLAAGYLLLSRLAPAGTAPTVPAASVPATSPIDPTGIGAGLAVVSFATIGPNSDPRYWYDGIQPGTVTVAGQPVKTNYAPGKSAAQTGLALAGSGIGVTTGVAGVIAGAGGTTSIFAASTALGAATLGVGIVVGVAATIVGMINAHHQAALAAEGKALNDANPRMVNSMILVMQAVLLGELITSTAVTAALSQIVSDWYGEVKGIQRGMWHYTGQDMSADYEKVWVERFQPPQGAPGYSDYHAPDPCNAACLIGHVFTERNQFLVRAAAADALAGNHGQLVLPEILAHATLAEVPEVRITY